MQPNWLICGGESGFGARRLDPSWVRLVIEDCELRGVTPFMKQWGAYTNNPIVSEQGRTEIEARKIDPYGKGGGLIDGRIIRRFPEKPIKESMDRTMTAA